MTHPTLLVLVLAGIVAFATVLWLVVRVVGCNCHLCGRRMDFFDELPDEQKTEIGSYFQGYEHRMPSPKKIFVCQHCGFVYDDFSGEQRSMEGDSRCYCKVCDAPTVWHLGFHANIGSILFFARNNPDLVGTIECLSCQRKPLTGGDCMRCDSKAKALGCDRCYTLYMWVPIGESGLKFLVPLTKEILLLAPTEIFGAGL